MKLKHPGETLAELMQRFDWQPAELAERLKCPAQQVADLVAGEAPLTAEMAIGLESVFGLSAHFWVMREASWRLEQARRARRNRKP